MAMVTTHIPRVAVRLLDRLHDQGIHLGYPHRVAVHEELQDAGLSHANIYTVPAYFRGWNVALYFAPKGLKVTASISGQRPHGTDGDSIDITDVSHVQIKQVGMDVSLARTVIQNLPSELLPNTDHVTDEDRWKDGRRPEEALHQDTRYLFSALFEKNDARRLLGLNPRNP